VSSLGQHSSIALWLTLRFIVSPDIDQTLPQLFVDILYTRSCVSPSRLDSDVVNSATRT